MRLQIGNVCPSSFSCRVQVVIDHYACVEYLTKYAAKGKPRSPVLKQAFLRKADDSTEPHRAIKKVVMSNENFDWRKGLRSTRDHALYNKP